MATTDPKQVQLSAEQHQSLAGWLQEFDRTWQPGRLAARVRDLPPPADPLRLPLLIGMVQIDLHRRWQAGNQFRLESYLQIYRELGTSDTVPAVLVIAEYEARRQSDTPADLDEFAQRFPKQAEELRQILEPTKELSSVPVQAELGTEASATSTPADQPVKMVGSLPKKFGRYDVIKRLGRGGMASVYLARDTQLDRSVAIKVPHFTQEDSPDLLERFNREARSAATLTHPNVCPVYDVGELDGIRYLTMAYIDGQPLADLIEKSAPLEEVQIAAVVRKMALALQEAHERGIIHRDLKPSNVMMDRRGEPIITDFGLARREKSADARLTQDGALLGTPAYMPPEQVEGQLDAMGPRCDIYSLGAILYEMLTRRPPFEGATVAAVLAQVLMQEPEPPSRIRRGLDARLEGICKKAMAKKSADRFASMHAFAAALGDFLEGRPGAHEPILVQPAPPPRAGSTVPLMVEPVHQTVRVQVVEPKPTASLAKPGSGSTRTVPRQGSTAKMRRAATVRMEASPAKHKSQTWLGIVVAGTTVGALLLILFGLMMVAVIADSATPSSPRTAPTSAKGFK